MRRLLTWRPVPPPARAQGRIFMTHPTKAIYHSLLRDFARGAKVRAG